MLYENDHKNARNDAKENDPLIFHRSSGGVFDISDGKSSFLYLTMISLPIYLKLNIHLRKLNIE